MTVDPWATPTNPPDYPATFPSAPEVDYRRRLRRFGAVLGFYTAYLLVIRAINDLHELPKLKPTGNRVSAPSLATLAILYLLAAAALIVGGILAIMGKELILIVGCVLALVSLIVLVIVNGPRNIAIEYSVWPIGCLILVVPSSQQMTDWRKRKLAAQR